MGYIHDFDKRISDLLADVDEETRAAVVKLAKETVIESFRNGITAGKAGGMRKAIENRSRKGAAEKAH
jgi:hypothetical protein